MFEGCPPLPVGSLPASPVNEAFSHNGSDSHSLNAVVALPAAWRAMTAMGRQPSSPSLRLTAPSGLPQRIPPSSFMFPALHEAGPLWASRGALALMIINLAVICRSQEFGAAETLPGAESMLPVTAVSPKTAPRRPSHEARHVLR